MARAPGESRIPVLRSGIPMAFGASRGRTGVQLPVRATRPTALAGLTTHWPSTQATPISSSSSDASPSEASTGISGAHLGCEVLVGGSKLGLLRYFGTLPFDTGLWCGVELHKPEGLNDGSVRGTRLFSCRPLHGVFAPESKVSLLLPPSAPLLLPSVPSLPPSAPSLLPSAPSLLPSASSLPSGVKRQRTDAYESESAAPGGDEEEGSTPRQEGEVRGWSAEEEDTPPAEAQGGHKPLTSRTVILERGVHPGEEDDRECQSISPCSVPTPVTPKTLDWSQPHLGCGDVDVTTGSVLSRPQPRSISDSSICEMAAPLTSSTPTSACTPFSSARCARRGHLTGPKQGCPNDTCSCGLGISKQSSFELDESLGILTPDQMMDLTLCVDGYGKTPPGGDGFMAEGEAFSEEVFVEGGRRGEAEGVAGEEGAEERCGEEEGGEEAPVELDEEEELDELRLEEEGKDVMEEPCGAAPLGGATNSSDAVASVATAPPPARPSQVAPCFVASVTSITSIDPGYQGDGEWSRPASRADNSPGSTAPPGIGAAVGLSVDVLKIKFDTMTDSDFYSDTGAGGTESDADHEEAAREGTMAPGDRRAQVIDGTLYGGTGGQHGAGGGGCHQQPQPRCFAAVMTSSTATTTEEMESSGVFSDLDRRTDFSSQGGVASSSLGGGDSSVEGLRSSQGPLPRPSSAQGVNSSAAESSDVPQSPLEELPEDPKKDVTLVICDLTRVLSPENMEGDSCSVLECTLVPAHSRDSSIPEGAPEDSGRPSEADASKPENPDVTRSRNADASSLSCDATPLSTPTATSAPPFPRPSSAAVKKESASEQQAVRSQRQKTLSGPVTATPKKYKMPKRNVASKIKAMIEASGTKEEVSKEDSENRRQSRVQTQRKGRWDAIMSKIAAGQAEQRSSRPRLREVKSRVLAGIGTPQANTTQNMSMLEEGEMATRTKKPFISNVTRARRAETRRTRARGLEISSLRDATCGANVGVAATSGGVGGSRNHSAHSSLSDVSVSQGGLSKTSVSSRSSKKREAGRSASPFSDGSSNSGASNIPRPVHGPITRQPPHFQRDRTRKKPANSNALAMASSTPSAAVLRKNQRNNHLTSSSTPSTKRVMAGHRRSQTEKTVVADMKTPSARKPISRHLAPSGTQVQKPGSMRENNRIGPGLVAKNGGGTRGNTVVVVQRQQQQHHLPPPVESIAPESAVEAIPKARDGPPSLPPNLLRDLKHSAAGVEVLGVLIQYLVFDLEAFSTPHLKKMVENLKAETINTKLNLDEAVASCRRLAEAAVRHKEDISELIKKHGEAMSELEIRLNSQVEETQCRYEEELKRRDRLSARDTEALLEDVKLYAERAEQAEKEKEELMAREEDLKRLNGQLEKEMTEMQEKLRQELAEVSRTGENGKLRDEIGSLQAVLDLRTKEMHEYRRKAEEWWHKSEALNSAVARAAALQARVEDLEAQLQRKASCERKLQEKVRHLSESMERECRQNEQLALENEVLDWKLNETTKLMASLSGHSDVSCWENETLLSTTIYGDGSFTCPSASMTGSMMASSSPSSDRRCISAMAHSLGSPESPPAFMFPRFSPRLSPKSPFSDVSGTLELEEEDDEEEEEDEEEVEVIEGKISMESNQITPKVRTLVEKNESISWLVEMEEVIPAGLTVHTSALRLAHRDSPPPFNLLPRISREAPATAPATNSPSTSPTSSDPSSSMFCGGRGLAHMGGRKGAVPPSKKTRLERDKTNNLFSSTPIAAPPPPHGHHRHSHHTRYHHQSRATSRLPPPSTSSPLGGSIRSRSASTDSESLDREGSSSPKGERKMWRGGKACNAWMERVPVMNVTSTIDPKGKEREEAHEKQETDDDRGKNDNGKDVASNERECERDAEGQTMSDEERRKSAASPRGNSSTPTVEKMPSDHGSTYCDQAEDLSDQSPYHSKEESNDGYLLTDDNSSSVELAVGMSKKPSPPPLPTSQPAYNPPLNQGIATADTTVILHHSHHHHHHHHYQQQHVLSSLCAHPHLSIKESAGEAMISEEISDDTQGESEDEDRRAEKLLDSENDDIVEDEEGGILCHREPPDGAAASSELRVIAECTVNGGITKCSVSRGDPSISNSLKLGQQVLSSSTPDSSHFAQTDSSAMDLSWSEDLELMPSESEV